MFYIYIFFIIYYILGNYFKRNNVTMDSLINILPNLYFYYLIKKFYVNFLYTQR
jgi:hypothetical protein